MALLSIEGLPLVWSTCLPENVINSTSISVAVFSCTVVLENEQNLVF